MGQAMRIGKQDEAFTSICTSDATSITVRGQMIDEPIYQRAKRMLGE